MKVARDTLLGLVFFGVLLLLIVATVFLSDRLWGGRTRIPVLFEEALGLKTGDAVLVAGVNSGFVERIELNPEMSDATPKKDRVRVVLALRTDNPLRLYKDYEIVIESASALGGRVVAVNPGDPSAGILEINERDPVALRGTVLPDALKQVGDLVKENRTAIRETIASIREVSDRARSGPGLFHAVVADAAVAQKFREIVADVREVVGRLERGEGSLGQILRDDRIANNLRSISEKIDRGEGLIGRALNDRALGDDVRNAVADIRAIVAGVRAGEGSLGKFLQSPEFHDKLVKAVDSLQLTIDDIRSGEGLLGRILHDKELGDDFASAIRSAKEILGAIHRGEGTIGRLVRDETLIRNLERVVRSLGRSIEDAREAAPIATFSSVLFGAF